MQLHMEEKCYTDICIEGKWFHHDHGQTTAYMLGYKEVFELGFMPTTEQALTDSLQQIARHYKAQ